MDEKVVQILEAEPGKAGSSLSKLRDPITGEYRNPLFSQQMLDYRDSYLALGKNEGSGHVYAIIDTGLMHDHPMIKGKIIGELDLVGEGTEDLNGHGTAVTLILLMYQSNLKLLNVKALDAQGRGTEKNLIAAFKWIIDWKKSNLPDERMFINISAGVYKERWGLLPCKGSCDICKIADEASTNNIFVVAAAGNEHGRTACPANSKSVLPIASVKLDGARLKNSGNAKMESFGNIIFGKSGDYAQSEIDAIYINEDEDL